MYAGKVRGEEYFRVQNWHDMYQDHAYKRFHEAGHLTADFYQTTITRPDLVASEDGCGDGVHYGSLALDFHVNVLANMMCNGVSP